MAASFRALRDDGVGSRVERLADVPQTLHLADQLGPRVADLFRVRFGLPEGKKHAVR